MDIDFPSLYEALEGGLFQGEPLQLDDREPFQDTPAPTSNDLNSSEDGPAEAVDQHQHSSSGASAEDSSTSPPTGIEASVPKDTLRVPLDEQPAPSQDGATTPYQAMSAPSQACQEQFPMPVFARPPIPCHRLPNPAWHSEVEWVRFIDPDNQKVFYVNTDTEDGVELLNVSVENNYLLPMISTEELNGLVASTRASARNRSRTKATATGNVPQDEVLTRLFPGQSIQPIDLTTDSTAQGDSALKHLFSGEPFTEPGNFEGELSDAGFFGSDFEMEDSNVSGLEAGLFDRLGTGTNSITLNAHVPRPPAQCPVAPSHLSPEEKQIYEDRKDDCLNEDRARLQGKKFCNERLLKFPGEACQNPKCKRKGTHPPWATSGELIICSCMAVCEICGHVNKTGGAFHLATHVRNRHAGYNYVLTHEPEARRLYTSVLLEKGIAKRLGEFGKPIGWTKGHKKRRAVDLTSDDEEEVVMSEVTKTKIKKRSQVFTESFAWQKEAVERRKKEEAAKRQR